MNVNRYAHAWIYVHVQGGMFWGFFFKKCLFVSLYIPCVNIQIVIIVHVCQHTVVGHKFVPKNFFAMFFKTTIFHKVGVTLFFKMISCNDHLHHILMNFMRIDIKHA
jgi:hypothetical protein